MSDIPIMVLLALIILTQSEFVSIQRCNILDGLFDTRLALIKLESFLELAYDVMTISPNDVSASREYSSDDCRSKALLSKTTQAVGGHCVTKFICNALLHLDKSCFRKGTKDAKNERKKKKM